MFNSTEELVEYIKDNDVEVFDIRFCDLPGIMNHLTVPAGTVTVDSLAAGMAFDGSSIKGFQSIHESDMTLLPDPATARIDPFRARKTMTCNFFVHDPLTLQPYSRDPRNIARKAEEYLTSTGIADTCFFGPRPSSTSSTTSASARARTRASTRSTPRRAGGTPAARRTAATSATRPGSRAATSRSRRTTTTPTCART